MLLELIFNKTHNMISIIIPIYNAEKYLNECLKSIQQQTFSDFEVLMVDDGSKDSSAEICTTFERDDSRFHYVHQENAGVSVARNTGLARAKGEWISFVDADDTVDENFLQEMLNQSDGVDLVSCDFTSDNSNLGSKGSVTLKNKYDFLKDIIYEKGKTPQLWSLFYKREIIKDNNILFTPGCIRNEDYEFFMKYIILCENPVALTKYVGYYYRQNPSSVMHQQRSRNSVLMSIEASTRVGDAVAGIGVIDDKVWLTSFAITTQLFIMAREKNRVVYDELHTLTLFFLVPKSQYCMGVLE